MSHLESLIAEYYDWKGYLVKKNTKVGKRKKGGWEMELDIVAYNPHTKHLIHLEPSIDAHSWAVREARYRKKFMAGKKYIFREVFTWLDKKTPLEQVAVFISHPKGRNMIAGGKIQSVDELVREFRAEIEKCGRMIQNAIPEQYPLLRTMQLTHCGYQRALS